MCVLMSDSIYTKPAVSLAQNPTENHYMFSHRTTLLFVCLCVNFDNTTFTLVNNMRK